MSSGKHQEYLSTIIISTLKSIVAESDNKQHKILFKFAVEQAMLMNLIAAPQEIDEITLERLRGECVK